jgi:hypothetical protein
MSKAALLHERCGVCERFFSLDGDDILDHDIPDEHRTPRFQSFSWASFLAGEGFPAMKKGHQDLNGLSGIL